MSRPIFGLYILITCYSRIIQNSELEDLAQDHRYPGGLALRISLASRTSCAW